MKSMENEAHILSSLPRHPCIIDYFGYKMFHWMRRSTHSCLVLPYYHKGSLYDYLKSGHLHWQKAKGLERIRMYHMLVKYALHMSAGLHFLHKHNVIHRDFAARNILLSKGDQAVVS